MREGGNVEKYHEQFNQANIAIFIFRPSLVPKVPFASTCELLAMIVVRVQSN